MTEPKDTRSHLSSKKRGQAVVRNTDKHKTRQRLFLMICLSGLVALGNWALSSHCSAWFNGRLWDTKWYSQKSSYSTTRDPPLNEPWDQIEPQNELVYHTCFDSLQCARLNVPMDWNNIEDNSSRVTLAIVKLPSKVAVTDPRYGGLLWLQIGGPGGSGVEFLRKHGKTIQAVIDSDLDPLDTQAQSVSPNYFDIIGIDPRGINNTTPRLSCFPTPLSRDLWSLQSNAEGMIGSSKTSFSNLWARAEALGTGCSARFRNSNDSNDKLAFHMNTTPVIADMVAVIEQHGRWRENQARRWISTRESFLDEGQRSEILERTRWRENEEKLLFWGFSYGTVIGATFAAMHPQRVERAVIDGVVDTPDYYRGEWLHNLQDTDKIMEKIYEYCDVAGPEGCALYTQGGASAISKRFDEILESIRERPIAVPAHGALAPDIITYSDVRWAVRGAIYAPIQEFSALSQALVEISRRNGTSLAAAKQQRQQPSIPIPECRHAPPYTQECQIPSATLGETTTAILCSDGNSTYGMTREEFASYVTQLQKQSRFMGDSWPQIRMGCIAWDIKPKWRYPGPFSGTTAKPMLIIGTELDPVTPIHNAHALSKRFSGSAVLPLEAEGHCSLSSPSLCMARHIRNYFQTGQLPQPGISCSPNERPFIGVTDHGDASEAEMLERLRWTSRHLP